MTATPTLKIEGVKKEWLQKEVDELLKWYGKSKWRELRMLDRNDNWIGNSTIDEVKKRLDTGIYPLK